MSLELANHQTLHSSQSKMRSRKRKKICRPQALQQTLKWQNKKIQRTTLLSQFDPVAKCIHDYDLGNYSPKLLSMNDIESGTLILQTEDDNKQLETTETSSAEN